MNGNKSVNLT